MIKTQTPGLLRISLIGGTLMALSPLSIDMYLPAFPFIAKDLNGTSSMVQLSLSIFFAGITLGQLFYGPISDRIGRKRPLIAGIVIFMLSSLGCIFAPNIELFVIFRFTQAIGASAGMVISQVIVTDIYTDHRKAGQAFSVLMLVLGVAPIIAPTIGSFLLGSTGWRGIFAALLGLSVINLLSVILGLPETSVPNPSSDISKTFKAYKKVFRYPGFLRISLSRNIMNAGMFAYITASPFIFMELYGLNEFQFGLAFAGTALSIMAGNIVSGILLKKTEPESLYKTSAILAFVFGGLSVITGLIKPALPLVLLPLIGYMFNLGLMLPGSTSMALKGHGKDTGSASAILGSIQFIAAFAVSGMISLFNNNSLFPMTAGVAICGIISASIYLIGRRNDK